MTASKTPKRNDGAERTGTAAALAAIGACDRGRPFVVAQLGQSLDGRIATPTGASRWINRDCALDHLHRLRASVDAVVVGIGTVLADDPYLTVRRVDGANPARVVIDPNCRLQASARCMAADGARRIVIRTETDVLDDSDPITADALPAGVEIVRVRPTASALNAGDITRALFDLGLRRILVEGGARTVSSFIDAGAVDRLHLLVAPMILGSGKTGLSLDAIAGLDEARRPATSVYVLDDGDVLFDCDLRQNA